MKELLQQLFVSLTALVALLAPHSVATSTPHFGGTITPIVSPFSTLVRSSSTYAGTFSFSCDQKITKTNCQSSKIYISESENDKNFTLTAYSTSDPATAFQNLVCGTANCMDDKGKKVLINDCSAVQLPQC